jgi:subtilisin family serine protease
MRKFRLCFAVVTVITVAVFNTPMSAQNPQYPSPDYPFPGFPPEFSPLRTGRPGKPQMSLVPATRFVKVKNAIANSYIVVLNDDVIPDNASLQAKRSRISAIANDHAQAHLGQVGYVYETALKGYSIRLPNEAAAIAISENPHVKWVEEDGVQQPSQEIEPDSFQSSPPWGLDAIDGSMPAPTPDAFGKTNGLYVYNADGRGVTAYVIDTGINTSHLDFSTGFFSRATVAADCIAHANCQSGPPSQFTDSLCVSPMPNSINNDCWGHGTYVAGILGGNTYGAAKQVTIKSVKVCTVNDLCPDSVIIAGVNWVTNNHLANPDLPAVANYSLSGDKSSPVNPPFTDPAGVDTAINNSINNGVTYVVAAGNSNRDASRNYPADVAAALTVGAVDWAGSRWVVFASLGSSWGSSVDLFAPGVNVVSALYGNNLGCAWLGGNNEWCISSGTSAATPHVSGAVAMYLQSRTGTFTCGALPIQGPASPYGGDISTCADRVGRFIDANANLNKLNSSINGTIYDQNGNPISIPSANRFLWTNPIPTNRNPIDNQRFFVWQQYADFQPQHYITHLPQSEPDEGGLDWWTNEIIGHGHCTAGVNDNNACTDLWRVLTSRAFFVATHESWFNSSYGLAPSNDPSHADANERFITEAYTIYLRRPADTSGFNFWYNDLLTWGNPANQDGVLHMVSAFVHSGVPDGYRQRFGAP